MKLQNTRNTFDFLKNKTCESDEVYENPTKSLISKEQCFSKEEESEISEISEIFSISKIDPENLKRKYIENDNEESILCDNIVEQIHKNEPEILEILEISEIPKAQNLKIIKPRRKIIKLTEFTNIEPLYLNDNVSYNPRTRMCHTCESLPCKSKKGHAICKGCDNQGLIYAYPMGGHNNCRMRCANCNSSNFHTFYNSKLQKKT